MSVSQKLPEGCGNMNLRNENGFTMLEILASITILSIVVIPLMGLMTSAPLLHAQREQQTRAAFLAQLRLEELKQVITYNFDYNFDYKHGTGNGYNKSGAATDFPADEFPASDAKFRYEIIDDLADSEIKNITIKVWYDEDDDNINDVGEQQVELRTKVARRL